MKARDQVLMYRAMAANARRDTEMYERMAASIAIHADMEDTIERMQREQTQALAMLSPHDAIAALIPEWMRKGMPAH